MLLARSYSHHSLLSAVPKIKDLIADAKKKGYTTLALTDEETGSGLIEFYEACKKAEIKPVVGVTLRIPNVSRNDMTFGRNKEFSKVAILARDEQGYKSILELISVARTVQEEPAYHITFENVKEQIQKGDHFSIVLCGNDHELITNLRTGNESQAQKVLSGYVDLVGSKNIMVELAYPLQNDVPTEIEVINKKLITICKTLSVACIISPAPRYLEVDDSETFRTVLAIRNQVRLGDITLTRDFNLPSVEELKKQFAYCQELFDTQALEDTFDVQIRTDYDNHASEAFFPKFHMPESQNGPTRLIWETYIGLATRFHPETRSRAEWKELYPYEQLQELKEFCALIEPDPQKLLGYPKEYWDKSGKIVEYIDRMEYELDIIIQKGYPEYFLVFGDIMNFCRENGIVINTRGSAAGSLVGYLNSINILDPLLYNIPFERFLNPLRPSAPDIDGDFADDKRDLVIKYIMDTYGQDKVSQIITFGTMLPRAAVRDVGRVLGVSYKKCDRLAKLIPNAPQGRKTTFDWAFETSKELTEYCEKDEEAQRIITICRKIEGNYRHASSHAAGVIIAPTKLTDYAPLQWDSDHKMIVIQYDMKIAEKIGLVKMDILGIRNLAILGNALALAEKRKQKQIDLLNINTKNERTFELLAKGRTMGTFQLSGPAMTRYLVELEPTKVQDLMAMVALYRPGPMASIPEYIKRKKNPRHVKYYVPQMKEWMEPSYGIFVYQEDLLMTAIYLAGYDWGMADKLRKGMGKKIQAVIDEQRPIFVEGCVKNGLDRDKAEEIWALMVPFGAYGFNKAHSSSYGMVAYWTAYMKSEYPAEFMTALMTSESSNLDKVAAAIKECEELGLRVFPPDVNKSFDTFTIEDDRTIRYGLSSVKNLGSDVIRFLIEEREKNGIFESMEEFLERMSQFQGFNKRSLEALIWSGCLDGLGKKVLEHRPQYLTA